ncbi:MinD/ParA family protein [Microbacterium sorbitolivorans]|uniref:MinD/ParA family protein n=2 Tax=Microbacterium sorbitolivorans TaxID=1867410 RepID=A0A367YAT4_9MICO|nr:MinD/ParA family protein [Microbacterium sorbitolivorans]
MATATNTVTLEATATDPSIAILREAATTKEPLMVKEHSPIPAAVSADTASRVEEAARTGRPSFIKSHARGGASEQAAPQSAPEESAVLTDARLLETGAIRKPVPVDPWRRILHSITGGVINLRDGKATRERAAVKARIGARIDGRARFVPVMSRKGGVGKTTVTALLGMALADARDDRVVAVDANPDRGTLAERIAKPSGKTVRDLVRDSDQIHGYGDMSAHVTRDETRLDVLASDTDPHVADAFSDDDYRAVADIAQHYYSLVLTDTGTGIVHSVMSATLDLADQLVIVSGVSIDEARLASETLTWLEANGRGELAQNAIVVINQEAAGKTHVRIDEVESHFRSRVRDVVRIPYDPAIATGSAISFHELAQPTRDAARRLAALVVEGIRA